MTTPALPLPRDQDLDGDDLLDWHLVQDGFARCRDYYGPEHETVGTSPLVSLYERRRNLS